MAFIEHAVNQSPTSPGWVLLVHGTFLSCMVRTSPGGLGAQTFTFGTTQVSCGFILDYGSGGAVFNGTATTSGNVATLQAPAVNQVGTPTIVIECWANSLASVTYTLSANPNNAQQRASGTNANASMAIFEYTAAGPSGTALTGDTANCNNAVTTDAMTVQLR